MLLAVGAVVVGQAACDSSTATTAPHPLQSRKTAPPGEPVIRVRIERNAETVRFDSPARIQIYPEGHPELKALHATPLTLELVAAQWRGAWGDSPAPRRTTLVIQPLGPSPLIVNGTAYPGGIRLVPVEPAPTIATTTTPTSTGDAPRAAPADPFDIVNHVTIEEYLPGVLDRELYDHWKPAAFLAQAIAARSYAIDRIITHGPGNYYDVENTQASQAYGGAGAHALAVRAVKDTEGMVLTWNDQIITAYYSSTCGGTPQSPETAFNRPEQNIPPLMPHHRSTCCEGTRYYSWGPITRDRATLSSRVVSWGQYHGKPIKHMGVITSIQPAVKNELGRTVAYRVTDHLRKSYTLTAEDLRHAANFNSDALKVAAPPRDDRLLSSNFDVAVTDKQIVFTNGHGFGHGVGLCQYGAEQLAEKGYDPMRILAEYYPGAKVERAY